MLSRSLFIYGLLTILNIVIKMLRNNDTTIKADLRKRNSIVDELTYSGLDVQSCMVMLMVIAALLLSVISVVAAQNPFII
jgi:hypothetical protein